uniref:PNPLA domain-containing protein n=1 Tax=viral metagenome TaxID=1070528 RepID=A0A6C0IVI5_9ZZZZ
MKEPDSFFFCAGGWGASFYIGVVKAIYERWGKEYCSKCKYGGNSAGSIIALAMALNYDFNYIETLWLKIINKSQNDIFLRNVSGYQNEIIDGLLKKDDYLKLNGRLFIGVTNFKSKYTIISHWNNNNELKKTLFGSMYIPFYSKKIKIKKKPVLDGAFSRNYHKINDRTLIISVSKYAGGHILSEPNFTLKELSISPKLVDYYKYRDRGYNSLLNWNQKYKELPVKKYKDVHLNILWKLAYMHDIKFFSQLTLGVFILRKLINK